MAVRETSRRPAWWIAALPRKRIGGLAMAVAALLAISAPVAAQQIPNMGSPMVPNYSTPTSGPGSGTVTSVGLALPASVFTVSGSPVTTAGTLTGTFATQAANLVFAGPGSGGALAPTFRALVAADIPPAAAASLTINSTTITSGADTGVLFQDGASPAGVLQQNAAFTFTKGTGVLGVTGATLTSGALTLTGNQSAAAWGTAGIRVKGVAATFTDTSTAMGGTVASGVTNALGGNTIAATNTSVTYTNYYSMFLNDPTAGTNVTFTNKWSLGTSGGVSVGGNLQAGATAGLVYTDPGQLILALGTITTNLKAISITGTLNASGTVFDAPFFMNVVNTASANLTNLMDIQVGGSTAFSVQIRNDTIFGPAPSKGIQIGTNLWLFEDSNGNGNLNEASGKTFLLGTVGPQALEFYTNNVQRWQVDGSAGHLLPQGTTNTKDVGASANLIRNLYVGTSINLGTSAAILMADAANIVSIVNGANANSLRVYNTSSSANANNEVGAIDWTTTSNVLTIGTQNAGTGVARNISFVVGGVNKFDFGISNAAKWSFKTNLNMGNFAFEQVAALIGNTAGSSEIRGDVAASGTVPTLIPNKADLTTGVGAQASGNMSMIVGGAEMARWVSTGLAVIVATDASSTSTGAIQNPGGMSVNKRVWFNGITASAGLQTAVLCQSSGGEVIADSVACLASSRDFKENFASLPNSLARDVIARLEPMSWNYKHEVDSVFPSTHYRERIGFVAEDVYAIDPRLVEIDATGKPRAIDYNGLVSLLTTRVAELGADNDNLRIELETIKRSIAR